MDSRLLCCVTLCVSSGGDVASLIKSRQKSHTSFPLSFIWQILSQTASALSECHRRSFLHRDLKPHNLFLDSTGAVKLGDFGIPTAQLFAPHSHTYFPTDCCPLLRRSRPSALLLSVLRSDACGDALLHVA